MSDSEDDLFEKSFGNLKMVVEEDEEEEQVSEPEPEPVSEPTEEPKKKPRKKREMTPERKKKLLENLARGRETAKLNRQKKAKVKKIKKQKEEIEIDETLLQHAKKSYTKHSKERELMDEIEKLKHQLETQKEPNVEFINKDKPIKQSNTEQSSYKKSKETPDLMKEVKKQTPQKINNVSFDSFWD